MKGKRETIDRVNDKITYLGLSAGALVMLGAAAIIGFMVISTTLGMIGAAIAFIPLLIYITRHGKKMSKRHRDGNYNYSKKFYDFKKSKRLIVDNDDIITKM